MACVFPSQQGGREPFPLWEGLSGIVGLSPHIVVSFADVQRGGENHHHAAAFPHHAGGFLGSGLGLHLHIGSCAESTPGAGQGQQLKHSSPLSWFPGGPSSAISAFAHAWILP